MRKRGLMCIRGSSLRLHQRLGGGVIWQVTTLLHVKSMGVRYIATYLNDTLAKQWLHVLRHLLTLMRAIFRVQTEQVL